MWHWIYQKCKEALQISKFNPSFWNWSEIRGGGPYNWSWHWHSSGEGLDVANGEASISAPDVDRLSHVPVNGAVRQRELVESVRLCAVLHKETAPVRGWPGVVIVQLGLNLNSSSRADCSHKVTKSDSRCCHSAAALYDSIERLASHSCCFALKMGCGHVCAGKAINNWAVWVQVVKRAECPICLWNNTRMGHHSGDISPPGDCKISLGSNISRHQRGHLINNVYQWALNPTVTWLECVPLL